MSDKASDILILDDKDYWATIIEGAIKRGELPDCNTHVAASYEEAIALIETRKLDNMFQIALLDYSLSEDALETGYDVAVKLRSLNNMAAIYLVTLYDEYYIRAKHREFGDHRLHFIQKGDAELETVIIREIRESLEDMERNRTQK